MNHSFAGLQPTRSTVRDAREILPRFSQIAAKVLPHDLLTMTSRDERGGVRMEASSLNDWPRGGRFDGRNASHMPGELFAVIEDREAEPFPIVGPSEFVGRIRASGYRSLLAVGLKDHVRDRRLALTFWSTGRAAFTVDDLSIARRIADHLASAVERAEGNRSTGTNATTV